MESPVSAGRDCRAYQGKEDKVRTQQTLIGATAALAVVLGLGWCGNARAQDAVTQPMAPAFESKDGWSFDKSNNLKFFNRSPNPDGTRFIHWKGYTWVVSVQQILVVDQSPNGTQVKGDRFQLAKNGKVQSDKELMNSLKDQAEEMRETVEGRRNALPVNIGVSTGFGFRF